MTLRFRATEHGRTPGDGRFSRHYRVGSNTGLALLAVGLCVLGGWGILALRSQSENDRRQGFAISNLGRQANLLSSLEWQALAEPREAADLQERIAGVAFEMRQQERQLQSDGPSDEVRRVLALVTRFRSAIGAEIEALAQGDLERVEQIDEDIVDPTFELLQPSIDEQIALKDEQISRSLNLASYGSIAILVTLALVLLMLMLVHNHRRLLETRSAAFRRQAHQDVLTGLPNRRQLLVDLEAVLGSGEKTRLGLLDLDGFKSYNDTFGHAEGDLLLCRLARRLAEAVGPAGRAYRLGGDEFCVLVKVGDEDWTARLDAITRALEEQGKGFEVTACSGTANLPEEAITCDQALRIVDRRMYAAKDRRGSDRGRDGRDARDRVEGGSEPVMQA